MSQMSKRSSRAPSVRSGNGGDKCSELYKKAKQEFVRKALRTDKKTTDIEFER